MARPTGRRGRPGHNLATPAKDIKGPSPTWYVGLMIGTGVFGLLTLILNYIDVLPAGWGRWPFAVGLLCIGGGFAMTLGYR